MILYWLSYIGYLILVTICCKEHSIVCVLCRNYILLKIIQCDFQLQQLVWFFVIRGLVGIGEASYSTVAPTIIADIFVGDSRTKALTLFYFAIPCGR